MKKMSMILLSIILTISLVACGSNIGKGAFEKGLSALEEKDYEKVILSFEIAEEEGFESEKMDKIGSIVDGYLKAKNLNEEEKYEEAIEILGKIDSLYVEYPIKDDIIELKSELENNIQNAKITSILEKMETSLEEGKLEEIEEVKAEVEGLELNEEQNEKLNEIVTRTKKAVEKKEAEKAAKEKADSETKAKKNTSKSSTSGDGVIGTTNPTNNPNKPTFKKYSKEYYRNETSEQRQERVQEKKDEKRRFIENKKSRYNK